MVRAPKTKKVKIGISLDADLYEWLQQHTGAGREFASISHALERSAALFQAETRQREATRESRREARPGHAQRID